MRTILGALLGLVLAVQAQAALLLEPSRDLRSLQPGDRFEVTLRTGPTAVNLLGGVFDLHYDADVLAYLGAEFAPAFLLFNNDQRGRAVGASGPTTIADIAFSDFFMGTGGGAQDLLTLNFAALAPGASTIGISPSRTGFTGHDPTTPLSLTLPGSLEATVVPVPAALPLLATALLALGAVRAYGNPTR
ncbi:MAG: hypothetical protein EA356_04865 [Geminicoccaceae bacterium]|nr:MAG: hypothetical protein EA356_04865 [Geminicoccaceae bacterium]